MKKSELRQLIREEISQLREASEKVTVTNKKTGNTYEVSKSHYEANSDKYEVVGKKGFGSSFPRRFPWYEEGGFGEPAKQVPVKGKLGKGIPAGERMPPDVNYGDDHDYDEAEDWGHVMSDLLDLAGVDKPVSTTADRGNSEKENPQFDDLWSELMGDASRDEGGTGDFDQDDEFDRWAEEKEDDEGSFMY